MKNALEALFWVTVILLTAFAVLFLCDKTCHAKTPTRYVVWVHSSACPPCHRMRPHVLRAKATVPIYGVLYDKRPGWCKRHRVNRFPTILLFSHGRVIQRKEGFATSQQIIEFYRQRNASSYTRGD